MAAGELAGGKVMIERIAAPAVASEATPEASQVAPPLLTMYYSQWCSYCRMADRLLAGKQVTSINRIDVGSAPELRREMMARSGRTSVPQIFVGDVHIGGYDDLSALDRAGKLDALLRGSTDPQ